MYFCIYYFDKLKPSLYGLNKYIVEHEKKLNLNCFNFLTQHSIKIDIVE